MVHCSIPLRAGSLRLLMQERMDQRTLDTYRGDLLWSILASLHNMCKSKIKAPSYSDMVERLSGKPQKKRKGQYMTNEQTVAAVEDMLDLFSHKDVKE